MKIYHRYYCRINTEPEPCSCDYIKRIKRKIAKHAKLQTLTPISDVVEKKESVR